MTKGKRLEEYREKPKYIPVHPKLYPVIKDFHRHWFPEGCKCEYCSAKV